jgi:hypothetical protein
MTKDELHGFVVQHCSDEQLDAAIKRHHNSRATNHYAHYS